MRLLIKSSVARQVLGKLNKRGCAKSATILNRAGKFTRRKRGVKSPFALLAKSLLSRRAKYMNLLERSKPILSKAVATGEIDTFEASRIESQLNKCIQFPALSLSEKHARFFLEKMKEQPWVMA